LQRYFINQSQIQDGRIFITGDDYHHISRVMRMNTGDRIICIDNSGSAALCEITEISSDTVTLNVLEWIEGTNELPIQVTIASGLPKGDKLELIIQKGTELGASRFVPFHAARSIVKWDEKKGLKKVDRWKKIAKEAAEQSHRNIVPDVVVPLTFQELIEQSRHYEYKLIAYEEEAKRGEKTKLAACLDKIKHGQSLLVVFGPEGGLTEQEVEQLKKLGFETCSLGPRILRAETAPLYLLSVVSYHFEMR
jgi:16S rRNA (uracil1498-N3)-methyltransferase